MIQFCPEYYDQKLADDFQALKRISTSTAAVSKGFLNFIFSLLIHFSMQFFFSFQNCI